MTKLYETDLDLANEKDFMLKINQTFECKCMKLPKSWSIDLLIAKDKKGIAWAEIKCRNHLFSDYPSWIIAEDKLKAGRWAHNTFLALPFTKPRLMPFILFMRCLNADYWVDLIKHKDLPVELVKAQNNTFGDPRANRKHVFIESKFFKEF